MGQVLRCTSAFAVFNGNVPRVLRPGDLVVDDDPAVKGRETYFEPVEASAERHSVRVEQATAEPGERRARGPLKKAAAPKPTPKPEQKDEKP